MEACFARVCVAAEDYNMAIKNEAEGSREAQAAAQTKKSCESPAQLRTWE